MEKVKLTKAEALPKMRAAFEAGILCRQRFPTRVAQYRGHEGAPCIVGVVIDDETAKRWDAGVGGYSSVNGLLYAQELETDDDDFFRRAQALHDNCAWYALRELLGIEA